MAVVVTYVDKMIKEELNKGMDDFIRGNFARAKVHFSEVLKKDPSQIDLYLRLSEISLREGNDEEALHWLTRARLIDMKNVDLLFNEARLYQKIKRFDEAIRTLDRIIDLDDSNLKAFRCLREIFLESRRWEDALRIQKSIVKMTKGKETEEEKEVLFLLGLKYELAREFLSRGGKDHLPVELERVESAPSDPGYLIADWLKSHGSMARLLAVDAPLGWPRALGPTLCLHRAGRPLGREANKLFRRRTDDFIHDTLGKRPLDVGADRIARTAHSALALLDAIGKNLELESIPLAWQAHGLSGVRVIEVYPAATLKARRWPDSGYKKTDERSRRLRQEILTRLGGEILFSVRHDLL